MRLRQFFPEGSKRHRIAKKAKSVLKDNKLHGYSALAHEQRDKIQLFKYEKLNHEPLISIIVPAYNTPNKYLEPLVDSVIGQMYENWELIIVNGSNDLFYSKNIDNQQYIDTRIKLFTVENKGISENTNYGINKAKGEYIALLDHDDLLSYDALYEVVKAININPDIDLLYSDEDKITENGELFVQPHLKPDWSPDLLTHVNYITHSLVINKRIMEKVGCLDSDKDGSQDFDLVLRVTDYTKQIVHIPKVLYHWRLAVNSTAQDIGNKPYIKDAGVRSLTDHYNRLKVDIKVTAKKDKPGFYKTEYLFKDRVTVVVDQFTEPLFLSWYIAELQEDNKNIKIVSTVKPEEHSNYIKINHGKFTWSNILDNCDERIVYIGANLSGESGWASELAGTLNESHVQCVSALIVDSATDRIASNAYVISDNIATPLFEGHELDLNTVFGDTSWTRDVDFFDGKCVAFRKKEFQKYLKKSDVNDLKQSVVEYSKTSSANNKYNMLQTSVVLNMIKGDSTIKSRFLNEQIYVSGFEAKLNRNLQQYVDKVEYWKNNG